MIQGHGNDLHSRRRSAITDFSSNTASPQAHPKLVQYLARNLDLISNYPEPDSLSLREKLASQHEVDADQLIVTNGSTEGFYLLAAAFREKHSLVFTPSFSEYEDACKINKHNLSFAPVKDFYKPLSTDPDLVWLGNPNNPDGIVTLAEQIEQKLEDYPDCLFIIDEAYCELCSGFESAMPLMQDYDNLVVLRSMTKLYSVPGLRLGYLVLSHKIAEEVKKHLQPWNVNALAIEAGKFLLDQGKDLCPDISELLWQSRRLQNQLSLLPGLTVNDSSCNYFLVELAKGRAAHLKEYLLKEHGFLIRDASNFRGLNERFFRIAGQSKSKNHQLAEAISCWLNQQE